MKYSIFLSNDEVRRNRCNSDSYFSSSCAEKKFPASFPHYWNNLFFIFFLRIYRPRSHR